MEINELEQKIADLEEQLAQLNARYDIAIQGSQSFNERRYIGIARREAFLKIESLRAEIAEIKSLSQSDSFFKSSICCWTSLILKRSSFFSDRTTSFLRASSYLSINDTSSSSKESIFCFLSVSISEEINLRKKGFPEVGIFNRIGKRVIAFVNFSFKRKRY